MYSPSSNLGDVSSGKTLVNLSERRDSTSSTLSSVYTLSRRSSGISPCYSSRRSSQASQLDANRANNLSSADSYDPISADISRRSSQVSQFGGSSGGPERYGGRGLPSPLSLTPAQHYQLKAKYAAATGGAPPTPLPYIDQMLLKTQTPLYNDSQKFAARSLMPHDVPSNIPRRASDPVRRMTIDSLNQPQMHRYNSMGTLNRTVLPRRPPTADCQYLSQQGCPHSNGSPHRYPNNMHPPRISENVATGMITGNIPEEKLMLSDIKGVAINRVTTNPQDFQRTPKLEQHPHQGRMALVNAKLPSQGLTTYSISPMQEKQMCPPSRKDSQGDLLVQCNKVPFGLMDGNQHYSNPQGRRNLAVLQQNQNFEYFHKHLGPKQQMIQNLVNTIQQNLQQSSNLNEGMGSQFSLNQDMRPSDRNGNSYSSCNNTATVVNGSMLSPTYKQEEVDMETVGMSFADAGLHSVQVKIEDCDRSNIISHQQNCNFTSQNPLPTEKQSYLQPRPPTIAKSQNRDHSASGLMHQIRHLSNTKQDVISNFASNGVLGLQCSDSSDDDALYYTGQIQIFEPTKNLAHGFSPVLNISAFEKNAVSPRVGINQASTPDCGTSHEQAHIDFDTMLDDGEPSNLTSEAQSPGLLHSLSQNSSRLTTPSNPVTLPSVPAATGNMAIGDMSSLMTALAEESKFLNLKA